MSINGNKHISSIYRMIKGQKFFESIDMENKLSDKSKKLINALLEINYKVRLSAAEALIKINKHFQL